MSGLKADGRATTAKWHAIGEAVQRASTIASDESIGETAVSRIQTAPIG
jgi:hypothetical protein